MHKDASLHMAPRSTRTLSLPTAYPCRATAARTAIHGPTLPRLVSGGHLLLIGSPPEEWREPVALTDCMAMPYTSEQPRSSGQHTSPPPQVICAAGLTQTPHSTPSAAQPRANEPATRVHPLASHKHIFKDVFQERLSSGAPRPQIHPHSHSQTHSNSQTIE